MTHLSGRLIRSTVVKERKVKDELTSESPLFLYLHNLFLFTLNLIIK